MRRSSVTGWLLDTNVLLELRRPRPEPKVVTFVAGQPLDNLYISTVTLAEIRFGIELITDAGRRAELRDRRRRSNTDSQSSGATPAITKRPACRFATPGRRLAKAVSRVAGPNERSHRQAENIE
jgi:hypothetical protein